MPAGSQRSCVALFVFVWPDPPLFGLDKDAAEHVRVDGPLVALWLMLFSVPLFLFTPDRPSRGVSFGAAMASGLSDLGRTLATLPKKPTLALFLLAHMIYADGLITLFAFGGVYAAGAFGLSLSEVIVFGIALNVAAGAGAAAFAWLDDRLGSKRVIVVALVGLIARVAARRRGADSLLALGRGNRNRDFRRTGAGGEPLDDGAADGAGKSRRRVRPLRALGQGDGVSRACARRFRHRRERQPARRHRSDHRVLRGGTGAAAAGARAGKAARGRLSTVILRCNADLVGIASKEVPECAGSTVLRASRLASLAPRHEGVWMASTQVEGRAGFQAFTMRSRLFFTPRVALRVST